MRRDDIRLKNAPENFVGSNNGTTSYRKNSVSCTMNPAVQFEPRIMRTYIRIKGIVKDSTRTAN